MNQGDLHLIDLTSISATFPSIPDNLVDRPHVIQAILEMANDAEVIMVDGPEGIGKSTTLAVFAKKFPNESFSIFASGASRYSYNSKILLSDLSSQIGWALKQERFRLENDGDPFDHLITRMLELQKQARNQRKVYYFIIDGLHEIPSDGLNELNAILNELPFGIKNFKFLISGNKNILIEKFRKQEVISSLRLIGFTIDETERFFGEILSDKQHLNSIHQVSKMIPGNMASLRRLLKGGKNCNDLLSDLSKTPPDWLQMEWQSVGQSDEQTKSALAILAFYRSKLPKEILSDLCGCPLDRLMESLKKFTFIAETDNGEIDFVCEDFRKIAAQQLAKLRKITLESVIERLLNRPTSEESLTNLPQILHLTDRHKDLLSYLSPENIEHAITVSDSWIPLHDKIELALASASKLGEESNLLRFSIQNSTLTSLESADPWRSEIEAYVALEDFAAVAGLAQKMPTKEDRLHLFAVIAKTLKEKNLQPNLTVKEQIQSLYPIINKAKLGRRGIEIASDLISSHPELAIDLVHECSTSDGFAPASDLAFAKLSLKALLDTSDGMQTTHLDLKARIKDPSLQRFIDTTSVHFGSYSAEAVISEVAKWEKPADRIAALEGWTSKNRNSKDAKKVISYAIDAILKTSTFAASARVYYRICLPLPSITDAEFCRSIVALIDDLKSPIELSGPTLEFIKLQVLLSEVEWSYNRISAYKRLDYVLAYVDKMADFSTKMAGFAVMVTALRKFDPTGEIANQGLIRETAIEGLRSTAEEILQRTADHFEAVIPAIKILAITEPDLAFGVIESINTENRKDRALVQFINSVSRKKMSIDAISLIDKARSKIQNEAFLSAATAFFLENTFIQKDNWIFIIDKPSKYIFFVKTIKDAVTRCRLNCIIASIIGPVTMAVPTLMDSLKSTIIEDWNSITSGWSRVDVGFKACALLAKDFPKLSRKLLEDTEKLRGEIILDSNDTAACYLSCTRLVVRAFGGLIKSKSNNSQDMRDLQQLIRRIPCKTTQVAAWSELALRFHSAGDKLSCEKIVSNEIKPVLDKGFTGDVESQYEAVSLSATALYCAHHQSALQFIRNLPSLYADQALDDICEYIICKRNPFESYETKHKTRNITTYEDFLDICEIISNFDSDYKIHHAIARLIDGIGRKRFNRTFTLIQQADIKMRLSKLNTELLPKSKYIKHEGYKILISALLSNLTSKKDGWEDLLTRARQLPNYADATLVLIGVAENMPQDNNKSQILNIFKEAKNRIPNIPFFEDRMHHWEILAESSHKFDKDFGKSCIKEAWLEATPLPSSELRGVRKRLIDFAHRIEPDFATSIASELMDDPARDLARMQAKQQIQRIKIKEQLASGDTKYELLHHDEENMAAVAKMMVEGLNSGRIKSRPSVELRPFIEHSSKFPMKQAYEILSWIIENSVQKAQGSNTNSNVLRSLFESAKLSCELAFRLAAKIRAVKDAGIFGARSGDDGNLIKPGERDQALAKIEQWSKDAEEFIKITDPYFGLEELEIINTIRNVNRSIPITIFTSREHQQTVAQPWDETYQTYWTEITDASPGEIKIIIVGNSSGGCHPIHDRWILSRRSGLRVGTSLNSLGATKSSEISEIESDQIDDFISEFDSHALRPFNKDGPKQISFFL